MGAEVRRSTRRRRVMRLVALAAAFVAVEVGLRVAAATSVEVAFVLGLHVDRYLPDARLGHRGNPRHPDHDARGFYDPQALDHAEWVTLGDSQTIALGYGPDASWPLVLGHQAGKSAYNLGIAGHAPVHALLMVDEALALSPARLYLSVYAGNDLAECWQAVVEDQLLPEWYDQAVAEAAQGRPPLDAAWNRLYPDPATRGLIARAFAAFEWRCYTYKLAVAVFRRVTGTRAAIPPPPDLPPGALYRVPADGVLLTPELRLTALDRSDPRIARGYHFLVEAILAVQARVGRQVELVVVGIPTRELVYRGRVIESRAEQPVPVELERLWESEVALWRDLGAALDRAGIRHVLIHEHAAVLLAHAGAYPPGMDGHPTGVGHRAIAEIILAELTNAR